MQFPLFGTLPEGHAEAESIFMSVSVGSSPNGAGLLRSLQRLEVRRGPRWRRGAGEKRLGRVRIDPVFVAAMLPSSDLAEIKNPSS